MLANLLAERARKLLLHLLARGIGLHLAGDDRQHAVAQLPDVLCNEDDTDAAGHHRDDASQNGADQPLAHAGSHVGELAPNDQHDGAGDALAPLLQHLAGRYLGGALGGVHREFLAGAAADHLGNGGAIALPEEGLHALGRWVGGVHRRLLDALADLLADGNREALDGFLDRLGPLVDPFRGRGGEVLRGLLGGKRFDELHPARLLAQLLDGGLGADHRLGVPRGAGRRGTRQHAGEQHEHRHQHRHGASPSGRSGIPADSLCTTWPGPTGSHRPRWDPT